MQCKSTRSVSYTHLHKTKKLLCSVLAFCQLFAMTAFARPDWPSDTGIQAEAGALMDVDSGTMIFGQNSHVEYPPASITKLLTALILSLIHIWEENIFLRIWGLEKAAARL